MTEQEKAAVIDRAWDGWLESDGLGHSAIGNALEAVGFFDLVEAADNLVNNEDWGKWTYHEGEFMERDAHALRAALAKAKGQTNDTGR